MELKAGMRLRSLVCSTELVVVRAPPGSVDLRCGGLAMAPVDAKERPAARHPVIAGTGSQLGKRYEDAASGIEVLCTKAGSGALTARNTPLRLKGAKPLPSSD